MNTDYATVLRRDRLDLKSELFSFNLGEAMNGVLRSNFQTQSRDSITLYSFTEAGVDTPNSISIAGEIMGGVRRFVWHPGLSISQLIPSSTWLIENYNYWKRNSGRSLRDDINWDYAQVIRRKPALLSGEAVTFNLGDIVLRRRAGTDFALEQGDIVSLYTTVEVKVPQERRVRSVTISGEVSVPGQYQLTAGETLVDVINRAGGLTKAAYAYGLEMRRESVRVSQQEALDKLTSFRKSLMWNMLSDEFETFMQFDYVIRLCNWFR